VARRASKCTGWDIKISGFIHETKTITCKIVTHIKGRDAIIIQRRKAKAKGTGTISRLYQARMIWIALWMIPRILSSDVEEYMDIEVFDCIEVP